MNSYKSQLGIYQHPSVNVRAEKTNWVNMFARPQATGLIRFVPPGRTLM